ncbi:MAG: endonuclease III domain-containing protein [Thermoplasmataceae archaeon]
MNLREIYELLYSHYGDLGWWPADNEEEIMIGAVLTQNTSWKNVEIALRRMKEDRILGIAEIYNSDEDGLRSAIKSSGFYNRKASTLKQLSTGIIERFGNVDVMKRQSAKDVANFLGSIHGIGPETRDDILLYALDFPAFIVDSYTTRIFTRFYGKEQNQHDLLAGKVPVGDMALNIEELKNIHAMLVLTAKEHCRKKPVCAGCPLETKCSFALEKEK